jgi:hypothetical protein
MRNFSSSEARLLTTHLFLRPLKPLRRVKETLSERNDTATFA